MDKELAHKQPLRSRLRKLAGVILLALIAFAAVDGYFNGWKTVKRLYHWNTLELNERNGSSLRLSARSDFQLLRIPNVHILTIPESLFVFDQPLRDSGYYRLYFRFSDSSSAQLQKMIQTVSSLDTANTVQRTVEDARNAYQTIQFLLGSSSALQRDSTRLVRSTLSRDTSQRLSRGDFTMGTDDEAKAVIKKFLGNPQVIMGLGIGIAISAGADLLKGDAFGVIAKSDVFRIDSLKLGVHAGTWEGSPIDILWAMKKAGPDSLHAFGRQVK